MDCRCIDCGWVGSIFELVSDVTEDSDGDLSGDSLNPCPECGGFTEDL